MINKLYSATALPDPLDLFGQMLAQTPVAIWMADRDGKIILFNEAMKSLVDISDPEKVLQSYNIFEDPIAKSQGLVPYIRRVLTGQLIETVVMMDLSREPFGSDLNKGPKVFYVRCQYFPLKNDLGEFEYVVVMIENITDDYLEDLELSRSANELETANAEIMSREKEIIALKRRVHALTLQLAGLKESL